MLDAEVAGKVERRLGAVQREYGCRSECVQHLHGDVAESANADHRGTLAARSGAPGGPFRSPLSGEAGVGVRGDLGGRQALRQRNQRAPFVR